MKYLVTGGAGFIGRWVVKALLGEAEATVTVVDDFSNGRPENLSEFRGSPRLAVVESDVADGTALDQLWTAQGPFDVVFHLAAQIRVQDSIDQPRRTFLSDVAGTLEVLERCRRQFFQANDIETDGPFHLLRAKDRLRVKAPRLVFTSSCMVYDRTAAKAIDETHCTRPASPYAASKIASENLVLSYHHAYQMPTKVVRPFNTYGPFQKCNLEGGVVAIFIARDLVGEPLLVKGDGMQTRDLLYVEDCARFVVMAGQSVAGDGEILNAGLGRDISIRELALLIADPSKGGHGSLTQHVTHDHPQAEIAKLLCDNRAAMRELGWKPEVDLTEGIRRTRQWIASNLEAL